MDQAPDVPGFEIRGRFYPIPTSYRVCDPVLVREVTGMEYLAWADSLPDEETELPPEGLDPVVMAGLVAVAVWQTNTTWRRQQVVKYCESLQNSEVVLVGLDEEPLEPTPPLPEETDSQASLPDSNSTSEGLSARVNPSTFGTEESLTSSQA